jgi:hypothetical protein
MIGISERLGTKTRIFAAGAAACAAVGLAACSAPGGAPAATATKTVIQTAPASKAPAATKSAAASNASANESSGTSPAADTSATGKLPRYHPSTLVSQALYSTVLTSPDSVHQIGEFYKKALARGGWQVTSSSMGPWHASFTAQRSHEGASISVYPRLGGSGISISTHPM